MTKSPDYSEKGRESGDKHWLDKLAVALSGAAFLAAAVAAGFTGYQAWVARDTEKRQLRAYVSRDEPEIFPLADASGGVLEWKILPKWANHGGTPTRNLTVTLRCIAVRKDTGAIFDETEQPPSQSQRIIPPTQATGGGICSLTASQITANIKNGLLNGARSTVDYFDVFGEPHHSEQCFTVEFLRDPIQNADVATRAINTCERNCEDGEYQTAK
jgi:hypothetical protein